MAVYKAIVRRCTFAVWKGAMAICHKHPLLVYCAFSITAAAMYWWMSHYVGADLEQSVLPWLTYIQEHGRWSALSDAFHEYSGGYPILLTSFSYLDGVLTNLQIIKLLSVCGVFATSAFIWKLTADYGTQMLPPPLMAGVFLLAPTIAVNAALWGQTDIFYSGLLLLSFFFLLENRLVYAITVFGVAIAFKLQAIFFAPFLLMAVLLHRGSIFYLAIIPVTYILVNAPLLLAGRDVTDVASIYLQQSEYLNLLSVQAPNPWFWIHGVLNNFPSLYEQLYPYLYIFGLLLASTAGLAIAGLGIKIRNHGISPYQSILLATLCLALMPYLLPKLHDRYFFPADIFSFALLAFNYRLWPITAAFQLGSLFAYIPYFFHGIASHFIIVAGPAIGSFFISMGLLVLALLNAIEFGPANADWRRKLEEKMTNWCQAHIEPSVDNSNEVPLSKRS